MERRRNGSEFSRELIDRMAQAVAKTCLRKECPHALGRAIEAICQDPTDPIGWFLLKRCALELLIGSGKGCCTGLLGVSQMPDHAATDDGREVHFLGETAAVLVIGQEIDGPLQPTPREH